MKNKVIVVATTAGFLNFFKGQLNSLNKHFDIITVSSYGPQLEEITKREGVQSQVINIERPISIFKDLVSLWKLNKFFRQQRPLIVHGNTPKGALLSIAAAYLARVPIRIYFCHGLRYQGYQKGFMRQVLVLMEKITCNLATNVYCVSNGIKESLIQDRISIKPRVILHGSANGLNFDYFKKEDGFDRNSFRKKLAIPGNDFVFLFVGRIVKDKGVNELVSVFHMLTNEYNNISLLLVGAYEEHNAVSKETLARIHNCNNIYTTGSVSDVRPYMEVSDALVLPSYREGFGMVLLEAAAMQLPAIASNISGCNELVKENINGILVEPRDVESLYRQMERILIDNDLREKITINTREAVMKKYDQTDVWEAILAEYRLWEERDNEKSKK